MAILGNKSKNLWTISHDSLIIPILIAFTGAIAVGIVLAVVRPEWFNYYLIAIGAAIGLFVIGPIYVAYRFLQWAWKVAVSKALKAMIFILWILLISPIVFVTAGIPWIGNGLLKFKDWVITLVTALVKLPKLGKELRDVRAMMIRVLVEVDDPEPELSEPEPYRKELRSIRKNGENRLNIGETMLTLSLGALMLISQIWEMGIFQVNLFGVVAEFVIQAGLLVIAVSIGYRVAIMDFLSFSGDEDFHSLKEMDVAVSYQKGVCSVAFVQHLMSMIVLVAVLSRLKKDLAEDLLRIRYSGLSFYKTMREGWRRLNEAQ